MKKFLPLLVVSALVAMSPAKSAFANNPYVSLGGGLSIPSNLTFPDESFTLGGTQYNLTDETASIKNTAVYRGAVGYKFSDYRVEAEIGYQDPNLDKFTGAINNNTSVSIPLSGDISVLSFMANAYFDDTNVIKGVVPYVMGGIGVAKVKTNSVTANAATIGLTNYTFPTTTIATVDESVFAWQLGLGITIPLTKVINLDAGYRYFSTAGLDISSGGSTINKAFHSSNILASLRFDL